MEGRRWNPDLAATYEGVARPYADQFFIELDRRPFDRALLDRFAAILKDRGWVCDVGCGPGHVGRYLARRHEAGGGGQSAGVKRWPLAWRTMESGRGK